MEYDALGRFFASFGPVLHGDSAGQLCAGEPLKTVDYVYGYYESGVPMSTIITHINTNQTRCGDNPWNRMPQDMTVPEGGGGISRDTEDSITFIDSLGRTYATVVSGDDHLGGESKFPFVINGDVAVNAKGVAYITYEGNALQAFPLIPEDVIGRRGKINPTLQQFDVYGRPTKTIAPDGAEAMVVYGLDSADSYDHLDIHGGVCHKDTYSTQRVDGLGRTVNAVTRYRPNTDTLCGGPMTEKWSVPTFDAMGNVIVATQFERVAGTSVNVNKIARRAQYDTLGRLRFNTAVTFGTWEYQYDTLGQMVKAINPLGDQLLYEYDDIGRLITESSQPVNGGLTLDAVYFYDKYPNPGENHANLLTPFEAISGINNISYPATAKMLGSLVAKWDHSGISVAAAELGLFGESWRMVFPDQSRVYHSESLSDYAGQLIYAEDDRGVRTTASYYEDGTAKSSYVSHLVGGSRVQNTIVAKSYSNILGQTELVQYGDAGQTTVWNGYDSVMHRSLATVVQSNGGTLMSFGYRYNEVGLLTAIGDYRGRSNTGPVAPHPTDVNHSAVGYHFPSLSSASAYGFDYAMAAPTSFNGSNYNGITQTGWPIAAAPSDAEFSYDSRYQLVGEDRDYITGSGDDWTNPTDQTSKRLRSVHWDFDARGNMTSWKEEGDGTGIATKNLGRALGGTIINGWQLNQQSGNESCMYALETSTTRPANCKIPDAVYFATNIGDEGLAQGKGTCIWANYDPMGRMTRQTVRIGCSSCSYAGGANGATCTDVEATRTDYIYNWDARSRLAGAEKVSSNPDDPNIVMSYLYDINGNRVVREKSQVNGTPGSIANIYQDVYLGGIERRHVQLRNQWGQARSINTTGEILTYQNVENTRELHYAGGVRLEWDNGDSGNGISNLPPKIFLSFSNHLGSTSAVIDYETGALVEWNTNYAYGADESRWKNSDAKYADAEDPYGFTGKEEDKAVGLHYFGARYYSSYLGRWLSPDPPVVHGGGFTNHYNYGNNSPYIYIDPDGNFFLTSLIVGAVVGAAVSAAVTAIKGGSAKDILLSALKGAAVGLATGAGAMVGGAWGGALVSAGISMGETARAGGSFKDVMLNGAISFGTSMLGAAIGKIGPANGPMSFGMAFGKKALSYVAGLTAAYTGAALLGGLNKENWDNILMDYSVNFAVSSVASGIAGKVQEKLKARAGMGNEKGGTKSSSFIKPTADDARSDKRLTLPGNPNGNNSGKKISILYGYDDNSDHRFREELDNIHQAIGHARSKGFDVELVFSATRQDLRDAVYSDQTAGVFWSGEGTHKGDGSVFGADIQEVRPKDIDPSSIGSNLKFVIISSCESSNYSNAKITWESRFGTDVKFEGWAETFTYDRTIDFTTTPSNAGAEFWDKWESPHGGNNKWWEFKDYIDYASK